MPLYLAHATDTPAPSAITEKPALTLAWVNAVAPKKKHMGFTAEEVYAQLGTHSREVLAAQARIDAQRKQQKPARHLKLVGKQAGGSLLADGRHNWYPH
jgi:hypothetical protein